MNKFPLPALAIISVLLLGCNSQNAFQQKQNCSTYIDKVSKEFKEAYGEKGSSEPEVFYSPTLDTCVAGYVTSSDNGETTHFYLKNILENTEIYQKNYTKDQEGKLSNEGKTKWDDYERKIDELKNN